MELRGRRGSGGSRGRHNGVFARCDVSVVAQMSTCESVLTMGRAMKGGRCGEGVSDGGEREGQGRGDADGGFVSGRASDERVARPDYVRASTMSRYLVWDSAESESRTLGAWDTRHAGGRHTRLTKKHKTLSQLLPHVQLGRRLTSSLPSSPSPHSASTHPRDFSVRT